MFVLWHTVPRAVHHSEDISRELVCMCVCVGGGGGCVRACVRTCVRTCVCV